MATPFGDDEPKYGLCVTGYVHPDKALRNVGARPGDALVLTKPLGTGVLTTAAKADLLEPEQYGRLVRSMARLNAHAAKAVSQMPGDPRLYGRHRLRTSGPRR